MPACLLRLAIAAALATVPATSAGAAPLARVPLPLVGDGVPSSYLLRGPALAGDAVVVGTRAGSDGTPARLLAVPAAGGPPRDLPGATSAFAAGAAGVLARLDIRTGGGTDRNDPEYIAAETLTAGPVGGPAQILGNCIAPVAADGARVAYVSGEGSACDSVVVRDVLADREVARWPVGGPALRSTDAVPFLQPPLQLAGDRVAWTRSDPTGVRVVVADVATGALRVEVEPSDTFSFALAPDGTLAFRRNTGFQEDWINRIVLRGPDGADREIAAWSAWASDVTLVGFNGDHLVVVRRQHARPQELRAGTTEVLDLAPDGAMRTLLRARPPVEPPATATGQELLGLDVEDGRIAWMLRSCEEADVGAAAIADLPVGGIDATAPEHCPRPVLERTTLRLDRRARTTVAMRCPAACSGTLTLTGRSSSGSEYTSRRLARRTFALPAGRHRIRVLVTDEDRAWVAHGRSRARPGELALVGTTGTRPSSRVAAVRVIAEQR